MKFLKSQNEFSYFIGNFFQIVSIVPIYNKYLTTNRKNGKITNSSCHYGRAVRMPHLSP